jgi:hypothetical protein
VETEYIEYNDKGESIGRRMHPTDKQNFIDALISGDYAEEAASISGAYPWNDDEPYCYTDPDLEHEDTEICDYCASLTPADAPWTGLAHALDDDRPTTYTRDALALLARTLLTIDKEFPNA